MPPTSARLFLAEQSSYFQSQRIEANEASGVALIVLRSLAFHRRDLWMIETLRTLAAGDDDVAFVENGRIRN